MVRAGGSLACKLRYVHPRYAARARRACTTQYGGPDVHSSTPPLCVPFIHGFEGLSHLVERRCG